MVQLNIFEKTLLYQFLSCHQVWLNLPMDNRHFWLYHKIDPKKYIGGYPKQQMKMLKNEKRKKKKKREGVVWGDRWSNVTARDFTFFYFSVTTVFYCGGPGATVAPIGVLVEKRITVLRTATSSSPLKVAGVCAASPSARNTTLAETLDYLRSLLALEPQIRACPPLL
jgi:hypothetical protein